MPGRFTPPSPAVRHTKGAWPFSITMAHRNFSSKPVVEAQAMLSGYRTPTNERHAFPCPGVRSIA